MNEQAFHEIIRGHFDNISKDKSKVVRIFLSSTFSGEIFFHNKELNYFQLKLKC
jgi:hypothetical protein